MREKVTTQSKCLTILKIQFFKIQFVKLLFPEIIICWCLMFFSLMFHSFIYLFFRYIINENDTVKTFIILQKIFIIFTRNKIINDENCYIHNIHYLN